MILMIADFWTTKCTRCPDALDKFDSMAKDPKYENVQFISICCDKLDGARDIIEQEENSRWQNVNHYFMDEKDKEVAKKILGFKSVPFYVVLDEAGGIRQKGNQKAIDFDEVPGVVRPEPEPLHFEEVPGVVRSELEPLHFEEVLGVVRPEPEPLHFEEEEKEDDGFGLDFALDFTLDFSNKQPEPVLDDRVFSLDDDF
jgi:thiol-disulfide isomerase/thioredoxin